MDNMRDGSGFNPVSKFPASEELRKILKANLTANQSNPAAIEAQLEENQALAAGGKPQTVDPESANRIEVAKAVTKPV